MKVINSPTGLSFAIPNGEFRIALVNKKPRMVEQMGSRPSPAEHKKAIKQFYAFKKTCSK